MSDGITDASRNDKEAIRKFRQSIRKEVIESFATSELINELCKREGVKSTSVLEGSWFSVDNGYGTYESMGAATIIVVRE